MIDKFRKYIVKSLSLVVLLFLVLMVLSRVYSPGSSAEPRIQISAYEAADLAGSVADVCGYAVSAEYLEEVGGSPTFINFEQDHPEQVFTAVIWGDRRGAWRQPPERRYARRDVCVTGRIQIYEGKPQVIVHSPDQIKIR